jgi:hypothetical protein
VTDLVAMVEAMTADEQAVATRVLDAVSRPLTAREIEHALRKHGVPKSRAVLFGASLRKLSIVAVVGGEE